MRIFRMISGKKINKKQFSATVAMFAIVVFVVASLFSNEAFAREKESEEIVEKNITIDDDGLIFRVNTQKETVSQVLLEKEIGIGGHDELFPVGDQKLHGQMTIIIRRGKEITIHEGGKTKQVYTTCKNIEQAIWEQGDISLGEDDFTKPSRQTVIKNGMDISVTHVQIKEETKQEPIDFKTVTKEDDELSWRTKKVTQKGEKGVREILYKVVYYDGKEISRKALSKNVTKEPVNEEVTQGTYVKVGKSHTGAASWYAYTGQLCAANPWLPLGSYVKVTNRANGKSVIVKINDRGPFGAGRIIDLDKVAFAKIADLGSGVVDVKMEEITN